MNNSPIDKVKKIAILRANGLGDFIVTLPAIKAIRNAYPAAELFMLAKPWHKDFLEKGRTPIDRVEVVPVLKHIREDIGKEENQVELDGFFQKMKEEQFDIAIHFQGKGNAANQFLNKLNARLTAGHSCLEAEKIDRSIPYYYYQNEIIRFLEVAKLVGATTFDLEPEISILEKDRQESLKFMAEQRLKKPFIVFHATAMDPRRVWPAEKFAALGDILSQKGFTIVFSGIREETEAINSVRLQMKYPSVDSVSKLSLGGLASLMEDSELVISNDTGPLHLAQAVKAKTVGIYWAPNIINWAPVVRDNHRPVISWNLPCSLCGKIPNDPYPFQPQSDCKHEVSFVKDISPDQVLYEIDYLVKTPKRKSLKQLNEPA